jgi:hypothetical protein
MIEKEGIERMNEEQDRQKQDSRSERRYREKDVEKRRSRGGRGSRRDKGNKNRQGGMEIHKPREKAKGISAGREKGRGNGRNTNEREADGARGNRNHSGRHGKADKKVEKEKRTVTVRIGSIN